MNGDVEPDARLNASLEALLERLVAQSGFARGVLSRERLVSHLASRARFGGSAQLVELAAKALADREEYARIEALFSPPETWLFRYPESFDFLRARLVRPRDQRVNTPQSARSAEPLRTHGILPLRAFLAGCGGWCEPVSVAAALLDGAQAIGRTVEIVATDRNAALFAQRPVFAGLAVRGGIPAWASARFHWKADGIEPDASVLRVIHTRVADVIDAAESAGAAGETYDVVAFRNVAIYLDDAMRRRAFKALARIVAPEGVLLVGHAETVAAVEATGFVAVEASGAFALERVAAPDSKPPAVPPGSSAQARGSLPKPPPAPAQPSAPKRVDPRMTPSAVPATFVAAALACEQAGDLAGAERAIGRALYLDRTHEEALVIAARLATARGADDEAERFRSRAIRAHLAREDDGCREDSR